MKPTYIPFCIWIFTFNFLVAQDLIITGIIDGPLSGCTPNAVEFVALNDISDLSKYGFGSANNGSGSDGEEYTFPNIMLSEGTFIYVATENTQFNAFFGFNPDYTDSAANVNGDDAIELYFDGSVVDVFGDINTSGTGENWEYLDGWAYRKNTSAGTNQFDSTAWNYSGTNALDGALTNVTATNKFPSKSFDVTILGVKFNDTTLNIYPNPVTTILYFDNLADQVLVSIYSLTGQRVIHQTVSHTLDVSELVSGVYMMEEINKEAILHKKLIKH